MKTFWATAIVGATLAFSHAAVAETFSVTPVPSQTWALAWEGPSSMCSNIGVLWDQLYGPLVTTVDGVPRTLTRHVLWIDDLDSERSIIYVNFAEYPEYGDVEITSMTAGGQSFLTCDGNTFSLPGYVAPAPATIPTLSEWAMILLGLLLAGAAGLTIHRRRVA